MTEDTPEHEPRGAIEQRPICVGTGLIALDLVMNGKPEPAPRLWAGGSCGNVLAILAYLGWDAYPVARLRNDPAAHELVNDLKRWRVKTRLISRDETGSTPIVLERISPNGDGTPRHRYEWICPACGCWFPKYRPILGRRSDAIGEAMPSAQVFFFDRASRGTISLARVSRERGALVVFEPSEARDGRLFLQALEVTDVLKYAHQRLGHLRELRQQVPVPLEIETFGPEGLRYRVLEDGEPGGWVHTPAFPVSHLMDPAGSGDWCTAGIIQRLGARGRAGLAQTSREMLRAAIAYGQALAAVNCRYLGPRGGMYKLSRETYVRLAQAIARQEDTPELRQAAHQAQTRQVPFLSVCRGCQEAEARLRHAN